MLNEIISHTAKGVLGGAIGGLYMTQSERYLRRLPLRLRPPPLRRDPSDVILSKVEQARGKPISRKVHSAFAAIFPLALGVGVGSLFGLATARRGVQTLPGALLLGSGLGAAVWAIGYAGLLPATKLAAPLRMQGIEHVTTSLLNHVGYGVLTSVPIYLADRFTREDPWYRRGLLARVLP